LCVWQSRSAVVECTIANVDATQTIIEGKAAHDTRATPPLTSSHVSLSTVVKAWSTRCQASPMLPGSTFEDDWNRGCKGYEDDVHRCKSSAGTCACTLVGIRTITIRTTVSPRSCRRGGPHTRVCRSSRTGLRATCLRRETRARTHISARAVSLIRLAQHGRLRVVNELRACCNRRERADNA
jgi:hypothetical protein